MADSETSAADSNTSLPEKKSGYTFGHNETLLLISLYQKCEVFFSDVSYKKKAGPGPHISRDVFLCRQSELFLAFRTNHCYSRIVDKKNAPLVLRSPNMSHGDLTLGYTLLMLFSWTGNLITFMPFHLLVSLPTACRRSNKTNQQDSSLIHYGQHNHGLRLY